MAVLTDVLEDATGYGRMLRGSDGKLKAIVEHKDCTPEQLAIREINTGMMVLPNRHLATGCRRCAMAMPRVNII
jgi:bifunctional UDP-N-acetylglucosamine pyrophosphorylase/glucosamine-1-phosphate N-acetyltransferase